MTFIFLLLLILLQPIVVKCQTATSLNYSQCDQKEADFVILTASMSERTRIFLLGDSLIGQMCRDTKFCGRNEDTTLDMVDLKPNNTNASDWSYYRLHHLHGVPNIKIYHLGQYGGFAHSFEKELFWTFKPKVYDILILLFGAHFHTQSKLEDFISKMYTRVALAFPGRVFWLEPFPQHFFLGKYDRDVEKTTSHIDCFSLTPKRNESQFWRVETVRRIVMETPRIKNIRSYDILAPLHNCHKGVKYLQKNGNRDCTHYDKVAYSHVWREISRAFLNG